MATDFKYASQSDLNRYCGEIVADSDSKRQIYDWTTETLDSNTYYVSYNSGYMSQLFIEGKSQQSGNQTVATTAATAINNGAGYAVGITSIDVDSGSALTDATYIKIGDEILGITAISTNTLTVVRGQLGTTPVAIVDDAPIYKHFQPSATGDNLYDEDNDFVIYKGSDPNDLVAEAGFDNTTYYDQMLVDASMELNNLLDARYPTPLPKWKQIDENTSTVAVQYEYDAIVIKMTCYLTASNALRANGEIESADYYYNLVTNTERTGMADRLNAGEFKLAFEIDSKDSQGKIRRFSSGGTMELVETAGQYVGQKYDLLRITCTTLGAYGVAYVKVEYYGNDKLFGQETSPQVVTGGLQALSGLGGLYVRFSGSTMGEGDVWEIEVNSADRKITNAQTGAIDLTRRGYSY